MASSWRVVDRPHDPFRRSSVLAVYFSALYTSSIPYLLLLVRIRTSRHGVPQFLFDVPWRFLSGNGVLEQR